MSYINPHEVQAAKAGTAGSAARVAIFGTLLAAGNGVAGYALGTLIGAFWAMHIGSEITVPTGAVFVLVVGGMVGAVTGAAFKRSICRFRGTQRAPGRAIIGWLGTSVGMWIALRAWPDAARVGFDADGSPWWTMAWVLHYLRMWWPAIALAILVVLAALTFLSLRLASAADDRAEHLATASTAVPGQVTDVRFTGMVINGAQVMEYVVQFRDHLGAERWLTRHESYYGSDAPRIGDQVTVRYDPAAMAADKDFAVSLAHSGPMGASPAPVRQPADPLQQWPGTILSGLIRSNPNQGGGHQG